MITIAGACLYVMALGWTVALALYRRATCPHLFHERLQSGRGVVRLRIHPPDFRPIPNRPSQPFAPPPRTGFTRNLPGARPSRPAREAKPREHDPACDSLLPSGRWPCDCGAEDPREFPIPGHSFRGETYRRD